MALTTQTMTREQMKSVALEYLKRLDRGDDFFDLFADDAQLYFPKYGVVNGIDEIQRVYGSVGQIIAEIRHDYAYFNFVCEGDMLVAEGTSAGTTTMTSSRSARRFTPVPSVSRADSAQWRPDTDHRSVQRGEHPPGGALLVTALRPW